MKLRVTGTVKILNVEHRTSNIEHRIMMTLRFIDIKKNGTTACGELFGPELKAEGLCRIEFSRVDAFCSVTFN